MQTSEAADQFVYEALAVAGVTALLAAAPSGVTYGIYNPVAPQGASGDCVVFRVMAAREDEYSQDQRQISAYDYLIFAATQGGVFPYALDAAMDTALQNHRAIVGGFVCQARRVSAYRNFETIDGRREPRLGGRYLITLEHPL